MNKKEKILIVGAGLCGSMLALRMAQRGYQVVVYESRSDLRKSDISAGRSINLALSNRGLKALRMAGVEEKARELCIPMKGRLMHDAASNTFESNYSGRQGVFINSISRGDLNGLLLTEAEKYSKKPELPLNFRQLFVNGKRAVRARYPNAELDNPFLYSVANTKNEVQIPVGKIKKSWGQESDAQVNLVPRWRFFNQWNDVTAVDIEKSVIKLFLAQS